MALEDEVLEFTRSFFRGRPDLSTLTLSTVRQKFLAHTGRDHLRPEEKQALKRLVEEELLSMQVEDAGSREEKLGFTKAKRPPVPGNDPGRKRFRFNSESESSSAASSPDCLGSPAKDETAEEKSTRQALKKTVEGIAAQQRDLVAEMGLEESSEEEGEASVRASKVLKEESSEEEGEASVRTSKVLKEESSEEEGEASVRTSKVLKEESSEEEGEASVRASEVLKEESSEEEGEALVRTSKVLKEESSEEEGEASVRTSKVLKEESSEEEGEASVRTSKVLKEESSEEEGEASVRTSKVLKEESSEEDDKKEKEQKSRTRKDHGTKSRLVAGKASTRKKRVREESENSEKESVQRRKKVREKRGAKIHKESESEEEIPARKKENREEPRAKGNRVEGTAWGRTSCKQKSRDGRLRRDLGGSEEEKEAAGSGDDKESPAQRKSKDKTQLKGGARQGGSSEDEDSRMMQATAQGAAKTDKQGSTNGESDTEREVSDFETGGSPNRARKNRSSKKGSKKSRMRSCSSSSSDGSPEPKTGSYRRGEDHPAVVRLKRYIRACGAYRNYKKLLGPCRSHKERLSVLRSELEALGMKGNPSLEKCRALKEQREEAAEMASLDVSNIISSSGRPRRRTAWNPSGETVPPKELYHRTLESEDEQPRQAPPDWSHMRGIISSDGESN